MLFLTFNGFSQYVRGFSGAWYNTDGTIYIVHPLEADKCEIIHIIIDTMFRVSQKPETGIVSALADASWRARDLEVINFEHKTLKVSDVLYPPAASPIDIFGKTGERQTEIIIPRENDVLSKRIYIEDSVEIIREGTTDEYFDLLNKLDGSRLVVFNDSKDSYKYIFSGMELVDYGERFGEGDEILVEVYNENEVILTWESYSSRASYPGNYEIKIHYKMRQFQNVRFWNCNLEKCGFVRL
jgi:hypothetical protein